MRGSSSIKKFTILVLGNLLIAGCILFVLEIFGQVGFYLRHGRFPFRQSVEVAEHEPVFETHPYLVGRLRSNISVEQNGVTITTTDHYTRWTGEPDDCSSLLRVAVLGGSTAFGTEVTDVETWVAVLQRRLGDEFCVRNYGVPGYSTAEAIIQMALVVPEFQPHFVVVYEGWNDIRNYHDPNISSDYYRHGMEQPENLGLVSGRRGDLFGGFVRRSSLVRMARAVRSRLVSEPEFEVAAGLSSPDPIVDKLFLRNLRTIALLADHFGADALFVPQILNGEYFRGRPGSDVWSPHIRNEAMPVLMDRFNGLMKSVCAGDEPSCLFGQEVLAIDWVPDDFVDGGHFSKSGGEKFAEILSRVILSEIEVKTIEERLVSDSRPAQIN